MVGKLAVTASPLAGTSLCQLKGRYSNLKATGVHCLPHKHVLPAQSRTITWPMFTSPRIPGDWWRPAPPRGEFLQQGNIHIGLLWGGSVSRPSAPVSLSHKKTGGLFLKVFGRVDPFLSSKLALRVVKIGETPTEWASLYSRPFVGIMFMKTPQSYLAHVHVSLF